MGRLEEKLNKGQCVITAEVTPPKGAGTKKLLEHVTLMAPHVDAINVTDCQRALVKMSSLATCRLILDQGAEPVFQMTCRDRNSIAIQSDFLGASALGIPNVLCLTGDPVKVGDSPNSKSVFEVESVRQLEILKALQKGRDWGGNKLNRRTQLFAGAVVNPTGASLGGQLKRMEKKVEAGARFFQTQANYDLDDFAGFMEKARPFGAKMLAGVLVLHSYPIAKYIHDNIPGIRLPESLLNDFKNAENAEELGLEFALKTMRHLEGLVDGFHLMTVRKESLIPQLVGRYGQSTQEDSPTSSASAAGR